MTDEQIESAVGLVIAHYIPYRGIRAGHQISDSKGSSAAITTEMAILSCRRAQMGFQGPKDVFRNPQTIFRLNIPTTGDAPFDLYMGNGGKDFAVMDMHFKLGLYEHQSAGALEGVLKLFQQNDLISMVKNIKNINIAIYQTA